MPAKAMRSNSTRWALRFALITPLLLAACTNEPPPVPPAELVSTTAEISPLRLWSSRVGEAGRGRFEPKLTDDSLIVASRSGKVTKLSRATGIRQWTRELDIHLTSGVGGDDGQLYVGDIDGVLHALDEATGELHWSAPGSSEILVPASAGFGALIVRSTDGRLVSLDPTNGEVLWTVSNPPPALSLNGYSRPLILDGGVLVGLDDGRLLALNVDTGKPIWESVISVPSGRSEIERLVDIDADIVIDDSGIYLANYQGKAAMVEPVKGEIVWSVSLSAGAGIAVNDESLIVVDDKDTVHRLDKTNGLIIWSNSEMPGRRLSPPAFTSDSDVVVGDVEGYIHVLDIDNGALIGRKRVSKEAVTARPISSDSVTYVQSVDGVVTALRFAR